MSAFFRKRIMPCVQGPAEVGLQFLDDVDIVFNAFLMLHFHDFGPQITIPESHLNHTDKELMK